jgi:hypothetical protein
VASGEEEGTNGWPRAGWRPWLAVAILGLVVAFVNATSGIIEGEGDHWIEPVLWEGTSALVIVAMAPFIGQAVRRWTPRRDNLPQTLLIHLALTFPFAALHVLAIWVSREFAYWAVGGRYGFFDDGVAITLLYEWRKDVLVYAAIAAVYWVFAYLADQKEQSATSPDSRIEIRDGATAVFLAPGDILFVEAAGNYVEFHTPTRTHLVRGTLASWEAQLTARGFARVHRSRLVNRSHIAQIKPTPSGDIELTLDDGCVLAGSRRYRAALETPSL